MREREMDQSIITAMAARSKDLKRQAEASHCALSNSVRPCAKLCVCSIPGPSKPTHDDALQTKIAAFARTDKSSKKHFRRQANAMSWSWMVGLVFSRPLPSPVVRD
jgi:hypothetical protein